MKDELLNYRPIPFFFLNTTEPEALSLSAAEDLMSQMKAAGYGGALLFNKPPTGFDQKAYLSEAWYNALENFCIAAKKTGLRIWINDGWDFPPGDAGGRIMAADPSLVQYHLGKMEDGTIQPVETEWGFPAFEEPRSSALFHEYIYEGLASHLGQYFGDPLTGIFSDADNRRITPLEVKDLKTHIYYPWSKTLPDQFLKEYGYDLMPHLHDIYDLADTQAAADYWKLVSKLYHNWFAANYRWCHEHGLRYSFHTSDTGPLDPRNCRRTSVFSEGETLKLVRHSDYPGTDHELLALDGGTHYDGRFFVPSVSRGGDLARWEHPAFQDTMYDLRAKIVSSAAYLYGRDRTLCEAFAATNWDVSPEQLRRIAAWQIMQGINFFVPHAVHVKLFGPTKFFAPPEFLHGFPQAALKEFNDFLAKYSMIAAQGEYRPQLAVLDPTPVMWRRKTPGRFFEICDKLNRMAIDYVITDREHAGSFDFVIDPYDGKEITLPAAFAAFTGGELAYYRRFLPDGTYYFLAANVWSDKTLAGKLTSAGRTIELELAPGEIAVIGGPWEEYRSPLSISKKLALPEDLRITWHDPQKIGFTHSFEWENACRISGLCLLIPGKAEAKLNDIPLVNGKEVFVFDDIYTSYSLPDQPGCYRVEFADVSFETPAYLSGDFEVQYSSVNDYHTSVYMLYNLSIFAPEKEKLILSGRKNTICSGSWTEQGHPFYSGRATYECTFTSDASSDILELDFKGSLCEVSIDGIQLGTKSLSPYRFPLKKVPCGSHTLQVRITNTLGNQLEQFRVPSGLTGGRLLNVKEKEVDGKIKN